MAYKLTTEDFNFFIPPADRIQQNDILDLRYHLLPGAQGSGDLTHYFHPDTELVLYLDERENDQHFFIGGVLVAKDESILSRLDNYKSIFRPELLPRTWFLKGSGSWLLNNEVQEESEDEALTRWILWAKLLKSFDIHYRFHSCSVNKQKIVYQAKSRKKKNVERYQRAYETLFRTLEQQKHCKIKVVSDNVEGAQLTGLQNAVETSNTYLEHKIELQSPIPKEDCHSNESGWLQFVDMQIYALSRFISPSGENVLMDFEKFAYSHAMKTIQQDLANRTPTEQRFFVAKYYILREIFHHLRHHFDTNILSRNYREPLSTMALVSEYSHLNFAFLIDQAIFNFCNTPNSNITFEFSAH